MKLLVTNIQRFSLHDGPGIRTTVFLKGCTLHCPWCCNPENISAMPQYYFLKKKCIAKNKHCPYGECPFSDNVDLRETLSKLTEQQWRQCRGGAIGRYGDWYEPEELVQELLRDAAFWGNTGGVTFSGGEPLLQMDALEDVIILLRERSVNICAETCLFVPTESVEKAVHLFDELYVDIKMLDLARAKKVLGGNLNLYLKNFAIVMQSKIPVCLRHPQIQGYTDDYLTEQAIQKLLAQYPKCRYQVLEEHHLGDEKRKTLGL